ncbi:MAG: L,D-transpeptidase [Verrucomicrobiales bacterium]|nr:L,D-transpeptidase [Verrucomicrobiales bacterium]
MNRRFWLQGLGASVIPAMGVEIDEPVLTVVLDREDPGNSHGIFRDGRSFQVGFGRDGFLPPGSAFVGGSSLLGRFKVNAILSATRFEMTDELISESGRSREWLKKNLFANMSAIDFDGDGAGGEYGDAFIGLEPIDDLDAGQPFHFGEYKGVFRWYSYAIHGTQDEERIGECATGGCINVGKADLSILVDVVQRGDLVEISASD